MGQIQVTLVRVSAWRTPVPLIDLYTYRLPERKKKRTFSADELVVAVNPEQFGYPPPDTIRVTVDWPGTAEQPSPSKH